MPPMSTISVHKPQLQSFFFNGDPGHYKCRSIGASWTMTMDSKSFQTLNNKEEKLSVLLSTPSVPKVDTSRSSDLRFDRLQPSDQELVGENILEFGQFVVREAVLDEEYWTSAWLRAETHWENRTYERYIDTYKRKFAEQEYNAVKRRCKGQNGQSCQCVITVRKPQKNLKRPILKSVVATLDLNFRYLLEGETFPGERVKAPLFCSINRTPPGRYGYIANLCVAKSVRRQGIASNMLRFAVQSAKSNGVEQVYMHVDRNNRPAQMLYQRMGFEMVEMANSELSDEQTYLLRLQT
ncbi:hypothetical protein L6164_011808 [Bauhinia variegata]|uniref:Uncharacterized protein n=1 Tax=Bauhinia variegata TaxID=167791 RepID=A0ACB9P899_BAUVA|nr:hypothetical protein L6164_011808 [Bauhinia variegata]